MGALFGPNETRIRPATGAWRGNVGWRPGDPGCWHPEGDHKGRPYERDTMGKVLYREGQDCPPCQGLLNIFHSPEFRENSGFDVRSQKGQNAEMFPEQKRTTIYFDAEIHQALRLKSIETGRSLSDLVNEAVRLTLDEGGEDLAAFEERAAEENLSFEDVVEDMARRAMI